MNTVRRGLLQDTNGIAGPTDASARPTSATVDSPDLADTLRIPLPTLARYGWAGGSLVTGVLSC